MRDVKTRTRKPLLLDLFCGAGGASVGYDRAGFDVVGVDVKSQPRYPFRFIRADVTALDLADVPASVIHASPPCQRYSASTGRFQGPPRTHPDLVAAVRIMLLRTGRIWVMENVPTAPMLGAVEYCGAAFGLGANCADGVRRQLRRHRAFESTAPLGGTGCHCGPDEKIGVYGKGGGWANRFNPDRKGYKGSKAEGMQALGIDWMTVVELGQAVPPAYTELVGRQLLTVL